MSTSSISLSSRMRVVLLSPECLLRIVQIVTISMCSYLFYSSGNRFIAILTDDVSPRGLSLNGDSNGVPLTTPTEDVHESLEGCDTLFTEATGNIIATFWRVIAVSSCLSLSLVFSFVFFLDIVVNALLRIPRTPANYPKNILEFVNAVGLLLTGLIFNIYFAQLTQLSIASAFCYAAALAYLINFVFVLKSVARRSEQPLLPVTAEASTGITPTVITDIEE